MAKVDKPTAKELTAEELQWLEGYIKDLPEGAPIPEEGLTLQQQVIVDIYQGWGRKMAEQIVYKEYLDEFALDRETQEPVSELPLDRKTGKPTWKGKTYDKPENWGQKPQQ